MISKEEPQKITLLSTHTPSWQYPPSGQTEGELIEAQLAAVTDGLMKLTALYTRFKQELASECQSDKLTATTPDIPNITNYGFTTEG